MLKIVKKGHETRIEKLKSQVQATIFGYVAVPAPYYNFNSDTRRKVSRRRSK